MKWGFTGTQKGADEISILRNLRVLKFTSIDWVITGACIGIDSQVSNLVFKYWPDTRQLIIVPANRSKVCYNVIDNSDEVLYMQPGTDYRARNFEIVRRSDKIVAFWTGKKAYSGTYMTMNIAKKQNKLYKVINV